MILNFFKRFRKKEFWNEQWHTEMMFSLYFKKKKESIRDKYPELKEQQSGGAFTLYIKVEDLEDLYQEIKDDVHIIKEMHETFYRANEFAIQDPNSFILTFSDVLE